MKFSRNARLAFVASMIGAAIGCGIDNSLVGGRCRDGFVDDGVSCVDPPDANSPRAFADEEAGADARPLSFPFFFPESDDSGVNEGGSDSAVDSGPDDGAAPNDSGADGGPSDSGITDSGVSDSGVTDGAVTDSGASDAGPVDAGPADAGPLPLVCTAPLTACHDICIPVDSDPANCGACGKICASNLCVAGECQGATPGDIVLIGHDYTNATTSSAPVKVLTNAFTIPTTDPIRVLSFEDGAPPATVSQTKYLAATSITNRAVSFTVASSPSDLASMALGRDYDIVLIHGASGVDPVTTGTSWAVPLGTFASKGGVVLALDRGTSDMPALLTNAGLLAITSHAVLPEGTHLLVTAAGDVVGSQVLSPYAAFGPPVSFQGLLGPSADLNWVVRAEGNDSLPADPVVVHRIVR